MISRGATGNWQSTGRVVARGGEIWLADEEAARGFAPALEAAIEAGWLLRA